MDDSVGTDAHALERYPTAASIAAKLQGVGSSSRGAALSPTSLYAGYHTDINTTSEDEGSSKRFLNEDNFLKSLRNTRNMIEIGLKIGIDACGHLHEVVVNSQIPSGSQKQKKMTIHLGESMR